MGKCSKWRGCGFRKRTGGCSGCTYQHVWEILKRQKRKRNLPRPVVNVLGAIDGGLWKKWSRKNRGSGARKPSVDDFLRPALCKNYDVDLIDKSHTSVRMNSSKVGIKHDGRFRYRGTQKEFIIEYKGYPEEGQVLGSLMAASILKNRLQSKPKFYFLCHDVSHVKKQNPGSWSLLQWGLKRLFDGVYGLNNIEKWLKLIQRGGV